MGLSPARTAALLVVGSEILSGKVAEANVAPLAVLLRSLGIALRRVVTVPDEIDVIAADVAVLAKSHDFVFTSGGVGPTHDDVTVEAVSKAFGRRVVSDEAMAEMIRSHYGPLCTDAHLLMARIPEGASRETTVEVRWPTIRIENVWLLPGIPEVFRMKLPVVASKIGAATAFVSLAVDTKMDEGALKPLIDAVVERFPDVDVGSYPRWNDPNVTTKLTFDGRDAERVRAARDAFVDSLPTSDSPESALR